MAEPLLRAAHLVKHFGSPETGETRVLSDINLEAGRGQSIAIMGPSGSGKSTLLQIIGTLDRPSSGHLWIADQEVSKLTDDELALVRNRRIGFVFQAHHLLPQCTTLENVLIPVLASHSKAPVEATERARQLLTRVGLKDRANHRAGSLSGGERQRAAVVRALINRPDILLADEPTGALDSRNSAELAQLLLELNREENLMLLVATHSRDLAGHMQRVLRLSEGTLQPAPL